MGKIFTNGEYEVSRAGVIKSGRTIYFFDQVDEASVVEVIRHITQLTTENSKKPITLIINSPGGSVSDGIALYDWMRSCVTPIITVGLGMVASMGFIIYLAGDKRITAKNTRFLNHQISSEVVGKATDIDIEKAELDALEELVTDIVTERTGMLKKNIKKTIRTGDKYYNAKEAVKMGIAHEMIEYVDKPKFNTKEVETKE